MKKIILVIALFVISISAEEKVQSDSVDIRSMVTEQINAAKENKTVQNNKIVQSNKAEIIPTVNQESLVKTSDYTYYVIFFFIEIGLAASLVLLWIKRKEMNNKYAVKFLKLNVAKLRKEKIGTKFNADLTKLRTQLSAQTFNVNDHGRDITYKAKKYSISKGEVHLAAKLKMLAEKSR